jgi:hypothetical protein
MLAFYTQLQQQHTCGRQSAISESPLSAFSPHSMKACRTENKFDLIQVIVRIPAMHFMLLSHVPAAHAAVFVAGGCQAAGTTAVPNTTTHFCPSAYGWFAQLLQALQSSILCSVHAHASSRLHLNSRPHNCCVPVLLPCSCKQATHTPKQRL